MKYYVVKVEDSFEEKFRTFCHNQKCIKDFYSVEESVYTVTR